MNFSQDYINATLGKLQILHGRFADEMCNIFKRGTGNNTLYEDIANTNNIVGWMIDILYDYVPYGNTVLNDRYNGLTEEELQQLINYGYRIMQKYGANIFIPTNPNIYL